MKKSVHENLRGTVSVEHLHHFRCGDCDKWWSIGDPKIAKKKNTILVLPMVWQETKIQ